MYSEALRLLDDFAHVARGEPWDAPPTAAHVAHLAALEQWALRGCRLCEHLLAAWSEAT